MNISTKTEYALRALYELSMHKNNKPVSIKDICNQQKLPFKYTEQLFRKLKRNNIIASIHGAKGGYFLKQATNDITLKNIMDAVDENYTVNSCEKILKNHKYCTGLPCGFHDLWDEINEHIENYFENIKLDLIISKYKKA